MAKAARLLEIIAAAGEPVALSQIARDAGLPKPSVRWLLATLTELRFASQDPRTRRYWLGPALISLGAAALEGMELRRVAGRPLHELVDETDQSVYLAVLDGRDVLYLDVLEASGSVRFLTRVGTRFPAHATATGKAILAFLPRDQAEGYAAGPLRALTPATIVEPPALLAELERVREIHVARTDGESDPTVFGVASPVFDLSGRVIGSVGVGIPKPRHSREAEEVMTSAVIKCARTISRMLGFAGAHANRPAPC